MPRSNSVSSGRSFRRSETLPNSVCEPVTTTSALAVPLTTCVPIHSALVRAASGVSAARTAADFSAGKVSPVSVASSTNRSFDSTILQSPGTRSPAFRTTKSPGTIFSTGMSLGVPSRSTVALTCTMASNFSTARVALCSCQKPSRPLATTMVRMMRALTASCRKNDSPVANSSSTMIGLLNWPSSSATAFDRARGLRTLEP